MLTGKNICKFLLDVKYGMNTAIAIIGVMFAGSINLLKSALKYKIYNGISFWTKQTQIYRNGYGVE